MPTITDWLMVGITAVYVIATGFICWANIKSANASKAQLEESKRQFEETQRLTTMPFLYLEQTKDSGSYEELAVPISKGSLTFNRFSSLLSLKNIGNGTATNIVYTWRCKEKGIEETDCFPLNAVSVSSSHLFRVFYIECVDDQYIHPLKAVLELQYDDLLGHTYEQKFIFSLTEVVNNDILQKCEVDIPNYIGKLVYGPKKVGRIPMPDQTSTIISKVWGMCNSLRDDGISYGDYLEQLTYLIFLKMAHEYSKPPYKKDSGISAGFA